jgi:hypothetical protein
MTISTINIGTIANDGTGDDLREAFIKVNSNFSVLDARNPESTTVSNRLPDSSSVKGVFYQKQGVDLQFKTLEAGPNISLAANNDKITITSSGVVTIMVFGDTGAHLTINSVGMLEIFGTGGAATRTLNNGTTLEVEALLANEANPTLSATLTAAGNDIVGVDVLQAANVQSLVYGVNVSDRNSFIGFDMGSIQLDNSNAETVTNLLDYFFYVNPVDLGTTASPLSTNIDFGAL